MDMSQSYISVAEDRVPDAQIIFAMLVANWGVGATDLAEDFHINLTSGNIDVADDSLAKATDRDGNPRVDIPSIGTPGTLADMGVYERQ